MDASWAWQIHLMHNILQTVHCFKPRSEPSKYIIAVVCDVEYVNPPKYFSSDVLNQVLLTLGQWIDIVSRADIIRRKNYTFINNLYTVFCGYLFHYMYILVCYYMQDAEFIHVYCGVFQIINFSCFLKAYIIILPCYVIIVVCWTYTIYIHIYVLQTFSPLTAVIYVYMYAKYSPLIN